MTGEQQGPPPGWWMASDGKWYPPEQHPARAPAPRPPPPGGKRENIISRSWDTVAAWPASAKFTTGLLLLLWLSMVVAYIGVAAEDDENVAATVGTRLDETTTTTERETTTTERVTSTTTTTDPPTTTTLSPQEARALAVVAMQAIFEENRSSLADTLDSITDIETVDRLAFDNETVVIDVTSTWASPDNQHDGAWTVMKALAQLWEPEDGAWWHTHFVPSLQFVNSGRHYNCTGEFMVQMATLSAGREQWEQACV